MDQVSTKARKRIVRNPTSGLQRNIVIVDPMTLSRKRRIISSQSSASPKATGAKARRDAYHESKGILYEDARIRGACILSSEAHLADLIKAYPNGTP